MMNYCEPYWNATRGGKKSEGNIYLSLEHCPNLTKGIKLVFTEEIDSQQSMVRNLEKISTLNYCTRVTCRMDVSPISSSTTWCSESVDMMHKMSQDKVQIDSIQ
jgi:hypothetical protein